MSWADSESCSCCSSCGWGVPQMTLDHPRETLNKYNAKYSDEERLAYWQGSNAKSIDDLPVRTPDALPRAEAGR